MGDTVSLGSDGCLFRALDPRMWADIGKQGEVFDDGYGNRYRWGRKP